MMVFMLSGKDAFRYSRIKKSCDCRWGVVSQCMQNAHIKKKQPQYISNVLMKFNAKLGGATARVPGVSDLSTLNVGCYMGLTPIIEISIWTFQSPNDHRGC